MQKRRIPIGRRTQLNRAARHSKLERHAMAEVANQAVKGLVHFLLAGLALCGAGAPSDWPTADRFVSDSTGYRLSDITCKTCLAELKKRRAQQ